nr:hypothetical protein B296_00053470 [Ipomoea trifida]
MPHQAFKQTKLLILEEITDIPELLVDAETLLLFVLAIANVAYEHRQTSHARQRHLPRTLRSDPAQRRLPISSRSNVSTQQSSKSERNYQICHLDEAFKARVVLDVEAVKLDAIGPGMGGGGLEEVLDLVIVHVHRENRVLRLRHQLLAEVGPYEPSGANHTYLNRLYRIPVQIYSRCHFR